MSYLGTGMGQNCHPYSYGLPKLKLVSDFQGGKNQ